jgi:hypothetical protein
MPDYRNRWIPLCMAVQTNEVPQSWFIGDCCRRRIRWSRYVGLANGRGYAVSTPGSSGGELEQIQFLLGHVSMQTTERYLDCKQRIRSAVNDRIGIEPNP